MKQHPAAVMSQSAFTCSPVRNTPAAMPRETAATRETASQANAGTSFMADHLIAACDRTQEGKGPAILPPGRARGTVSPAKCVCFSLRGETMSIRLLRLLGLAVCGTLWGLVCLVPAAEPADNKAAPDEKKEAPKEEAKEAAKPAALAEKKDGAKAEGLKILADFQLSKRMFKSGKDYFRGAQ